jgi:hypothetical protein
MFAENDSDNENLETILLLLFLLLLLSSSSYRHLWSDCLENVGSSLCHSPMGLHCLLQG